MRTIITKYIKMMTALTLLSGVQGMPAQTENGFKELDVLDHLTDNPFYFFANAPLLAAADSTDKGYNAMTLGRGDAGTLWNDMTKKMKISNDKE